MERADGLTQLRRYLRHGAHSFRAIRNHTSLRYSDDQFHQLIKDHPDLLKQAITIKKAADKDIYYSRTFGMALRP